jgi:uncharacterized repeat protein (TIGR02543 family)
MTCRIIYKIITFGAFLSLGLSMVNCGGDKGTTPPPSSSTVTYNGNGNTAGTAPADAGTYASGAAVTVKGNTGNLVRTNYTFAGWNTAANGSGTTYAAGATFSMGSANITLYAIWNHVPIHLNDFILTMPGWVAPTGSNIYWIYNDTILDQALTHRIEHFVDGGDWNYIQDSTTKNGKKVTTLDTGVYVKYIRTDPMDSTVAEAFILDYGTAANATNVFNRLDTTYIVYNPTGTQFTIGTYTSSTLVSCLHSSSVWTFSHFDKYYIEVHVQPPLNTTTVTNDSLVSITKSFIPKLQGLIQ